LDLRLLRQRARMLDAVYASFNHSMVFLKFFFKFRGVAVFGYGC
jgi:hypothetical protein